ncbi:MAG: hypothetical protein ACD_28C00061G0007 [uncultured bacterium]|nr:MAG: hypothetical protein ACD_28C00061G0007 [uncultured bacterium]KKT74567.1 MAG: Methylated DNA-protein cysteine methyltransferase [Candidatus Peregrinibacteria bacterium GW2011_GWA2_44_7]
MKSSPIILESIPTPNSKFADKVWEVVAQIHKGETLTYKQVAEKAGRPRAFRAVGSILKHNYNPNIPCHRVIRSDGKLGEYNRGVELKEKRLREEGAIL